MNYGIDIPLYGPYADSRALIRLARDAEAAGWDGFFTWDDVATGGGQPLADPWIALAAIAVSTTRIRLGPMVTPLARRRPWKLARETVTLDRLSGGRLILGVGLGDDAAQFENLGEPSGLKVRAAMLDEALAVLVGLWSGAPFSFEGEHYRVKDARFTPAPMQLPRIPLWVAGRWPNKPPFRRAARWDGVFPIGRDLGLDAMLTPAQMQDVLTYTLSHRQSDAPFDMAHAGITPGRERARDGEVVAQYAEVGVTWWLEQINPWAFGWRGQGDWPLEAMRARVRAGPPRL